MPGNFDDENRDSKRRSLVPKPPTHIADCMLPSGSCASGASDKRVAARMDYVPTGRTATKG